jgi:hypothetical protein
VYVRHRATVLRMGFFEALLDGTTGRFESRLYGHLFINIFALGM